MENIFKNKTILVTGGTGTIGSALVRHILTYQPKQVRILSRNDSSQYRLIEQLRRPPNVRMLIGDIRDRDRLFLAFENVDIVFHAAALKHVSICEYNPMEAVKTNILGSQNIIDAAFHNRVKKVIAVSTDKAVDPHNVMGVSKLMMEKLFINTYYFSADKTQLSCVRFGNVVWANGSVLTSWKQQAETTGSIDITDGAMTRFFMSIDQAVRLILRATELSQGGEIFIFKMPAIKLKDLAKHFLTKYYPGKKIRLNTIGERAGEKYDEELFSTHDATIEILEDKEMFIVIPTIYFYSLVQDLPRYPGFKRVKKMKKYTSANSIHAQKIKSMI